MASKELISKEVDSLLFRMSNVFNMSQYMANSESRKFRVYFNPENGAVISQDKVSKNKELSRNYVYMDIEKNLEGKMAFLPYCIGYSAHNSKMQSTKERIDAEARIRSNLWHIFEVFENDQYQFVNRMIVERELSEITKNASFILNSNNEHINELIEETKKGIPYCNYNLVKDLFHKSGSDRIKVYVNSFTGGRMLRGFIEVNGNSIYSTGYCMQGGELIIRGDTVWAVGCQMTGGEIRVYGNAGKWVGDGSKGGKIFMHGDYYIQTDGESRPIAEIHYKGRLIWQGGKPVT